MRRDPVTPALRDAVLERDAGCVAPGLGAPDPCSGRLTLDHVKDQPMMGKRAPSDMAHLASICWHHHLESGWATAHRPELRDYLRAAVWRRLEAQPGFTEAMEQGEADIAGRQP